MHVARERSDPRTESVRGERGAPYTSVLCATDMSPTSDGALRVAYALCGRSGVVNVLHVCEPTYATWPQDAGLHALGSPSPDEARRIESSVRERLSRWPTPDVGRYDVRTDMMVLHHENVPSAILSQARATRADVVVLGTQGRSRLGRLFLGSVAMEVLKRSGIPVILFHDPSLPNAGSP